MQSLIEKIASYILGILPPLNTLPTQEKPNIVSNSFTKSLKYRNSIRHLLIAWAEILLFFEGF
jgi:hypothetical protein